MARKATIIMIGLAVAGGLLLLPLGAYLQPGLVGADHARIVLTGSMEPSMSPGDLVFIAPVAIEELEVGDVVTYRPHVSAQVTYTHRVVEITHDTRGTVLTTQGDANEDPDPMGVNQEMLVGQVTHVVPVYGRVIAGMQGPIVPLGMVVASLVTIAVELRALLTGQPEDSDRAEGPVAPSRAGATQHGQGARAFEVVSR